MRENNLEDHSEAEQLVSQKGKARKGFLARYYGMRCEDASPCDLVVDAYILDKFKGKGISDPSVKDIAVDPILLEVAQKKLAETFETQKDL